MSSKITGILGLALISVFMYFAFEYKDPRFVWGIACIIVIAIVVSIFKKKNSLYSSTSLIEMKPLYGGAVRRIRRALVGV